MGMQEQRSLVKTIQNLLSGLRRSLPSACIVCDQASNQTYSLCTECEPALPSLGETCQLCGIELQGSLSAENRCYKCLIDPPSFTTCLAAFPYTSPIDKLVSSFKFSARFDIGVALSTMLAKRLEIHYRGKAVPQLLIPVPLHKSRLSFRGFNQSQLICRTIARHCAIPMDASILKKTRNTAPQTTMTSAKARKSNLRNAFNLVKFERLKSVTHIALVDDVVTTMATIETLTKLLQSQLDCRIDVWCLARANR